MVKNGCWFEHFSSDLNPCWPKNRTVWWTNIILGADYQNVLGLFFHKGRVGLFHLVGKWDVCNDFSYKVLFDWEEGTLATTGSQQATHPVQTMIST
jgi:hypothetical protein